MPSFIALLLDSMIKRVTVRDAQLQFYANFHDNKEENIDVPRKLERIILSALLYLSQSVQTKCIIKRY